MHPHFIQSVAWAVLWAITLFATSNSLLCNTLMVLKVKPLARPVLQLSAIYDWVACLGWAILIVFWWH